MFNNKLVCPICGTSHVKFQSLTDDDHGVIDDSLFNFSIGLPYIHYSIYAKCPNCKSILEEVRANGFIYTKSWIVVKKDVFIVENICQKLQIFVLSVVQNYNIVKKDLNNR